MRTIVLAALFLYISSCSKEKAMVDIAEFEDKYLTCDSIRTIVNEVENVTVKGRGAGWDVTFDSAENYTVYSIPQKKFKYYVRYSKIYYWPQNISMHEGDYFKIITKAGKQLILQHTDIITGEITYYYYTSE